MAQIIDNYALHSKITFNFRDSFDGGSTENFTSFCKVKAGERILYKDVCSVYPYICKNANYLSSDPQIYVGDDCAQ